MYFVHKFAALLAVHAILKSPRQIGKCENKDDYFS